jgi:signal transduction histidine kinase
VAVALGGLAALRTVDLASRRTQILRTAERRAENLALILGAHVRETIAATDASLRQLAIHSRRVGGPLASTAEWLPILTSARAGLTSVSSLTVQDSAGIIRHSTQLNIVGQSRSSEFVSQRLSADTADRLVASTPFQTLFPKDRQRILIPLGRRLTASDGRYAGAVVAMFAPDALRGVFRNVHVGDEGSIWTYHTSGFVLLHEPSTTNPIGERATGQPLFEVARRHGGTGLFRGTPTMNSPMSRAAFTTLTDHLVIVAVALSERELLAEWRRDAISSAVVIGLIALLASVMVFALFRQIEHRRAAELALSRSQRLESLGHLTGGVAHDFNNLLTVIIGNVSLLKAQASMGMAVPDDSTVDEIDRAARRAADLTRQLLAFARRQPLAPKVLDLGAIAHGMGTMLQRVLGEEINLRFDLARQPCLASVDQSQIEIAVLNLCLNARDAMPRGGVLVIETSSVALDEEYAREEEDLTPGRYSVIAVTDTGTGIAPEQLQHVFEPFYTTKPPGAGTGLGLSMVYGFVKQSGGNVKVYSELGHGTSVKMFFPEVVGTADVPMSALPPADVAGSGEVILLVEDEEGVRRLASRILEGLGYRVVDVPDAPAALEVARREKRLDLLLTDVVLPKGMSGRDLARELGRERPDLPVLYASGYSMEMVRHREQSDEPMRLINKPFDRHALAKAVREAIDADGRAATRGS